MTDIYDALDDPGLVAWVILIQDAEFNPPTAGFCKQYAKSHPTSMRMLFDPTGGMAIYGEKETSVISDGDGVIVFEGHSDTPDLIERALIAKLSDVEGACWADEQCGEEQRCALAPEPIEGYAVSLCVEATLVDDPIR